ncbi:LysE family translocator [Arcobacter peruensis]|uniref:LysE family translocator n=1 Tax=Arcobacter peruensis TaxID=2320140 RepID=UPI000F08933B|nr:LysE family translocator [Arcobacter peruensis]
MTLTILIAMLSFSLAMSISPGPVNILILSSSINNGFLKTFAFISGATIGFTLLLIFVSFGLSTILLDYPDFLKYLGLFGALFIIFMGYKIASSTPDIEIKDDIKYLKFYEGFLLQWLNPKAWIASVSGTSMFSINQSSLLIFVVIYFIVCYLSLSSWGLLGQKAKALLNTNSRLKVFNIFMGSILIFSALSLIVINFSK